MNKIEFSNQWVRLTNAYPNARKQPPEEEAFAAISWAHENHLAAAVSNIIANSKFFPSIAELRRETNIVKNGTDTGIKIGIGILAGDAAHEDRCTAILSTEPPKICGVDITGENKSPDRYLCMGHYRTKNNYKTV